MRAPFLWWWWNRWSGRHPIDWAAAIPVRLDPDATYSFDDQPGRECHDGTEGDVRESTLARDSHQAGRDADREREPHRDVLDTGAAGAGVTDARHEQREQH